MVEGDAETERVTEEVRGGVCEIVSVTLAVLEVESDPVEVVDSVIDTVDEDDSEVEPESVRLSDAVSDAVRDVESELESDTESETLLLSVPESECVDDSVKLTVDEEDAVRVSGGVCVPETEKL